MRYVKICGVTCEEDVEVVCAAGASAVGINLVAESPRCVEPARARALILAVAGRVETVAVVRAAPAGELRRLREALAVDWLQVHDELGSALPRELSACFCAVRIGDAADVEVARDVPGERLLVDAKVTGALGGTGRTFDWSLVAGLARSRRLVLAGGLHPGNVSEAVAVVAPWGVDVASGVERAGEPRRKDADRVTAFVRAARGVTR
jgi:phosphoribosylanthranilate isomerase